MGLSRTIDLNIGIYFYHKLSKYIDLFEMNLDCIFILNRFSVVLSWLLTLIIFWRLFTFSDNIVS